MERQKSPPIVYKDIKLDCGYRLDLLVENQVVIEIKSVGELDAVHDVCNPSSTPNSPRKPVQIVESARDGDRVKQRIVRYVGIAMDEQELEKLKELGEHIKAKIEREKHPSLFPPEKLAELAGVTYYADPNSKIGFCLDLFLSGFTLDLANSQEFASLSALCQTQNRRCAPKFRFLNLDRYTYFLNAKENYTICGVGRKLGDNLWV